MCCRSPRGWRALAMALGLCGVLGVTAAPHPLLAAPGPKAQVQKAEQLNAKARESFKAGRFDEAVDLFMQVYDLVRTPTAVFNAARAREAAHKPVEAKALYELYCNIEKSPEGLADARKRLADIEAAMNQDAVKKAADEAAAKKAKEDADAAQKRADAERAEAEKLRLEKEKQDKQIAVPTKAALAGVTFLPPSGETNEESVRTTQEVLGAAQQEARSAQFGDVHAVGEYTQAEATRTLPGGCDFRCQLGIARSLGSAYALTTALSSVGGQWRLRLVLWRTADTTDAGHTEVVAYTLPGLAQRGRRAAGEVFNGVRKLTVAVVPTPSAPAPNSPANLLIDSDPAGSAVVVDDVERGAAPLTVALPPGAHIVRVQRAGYLARGGVAQLQSGTQRVTLALAPQLPAEAAPAGPIPQIATVQLPGQPGPTTVPTGSVPPPTTATRPPEPVPPPPTQPVGKTIGLRERTPGAETTPAKIAAPSMGTPTAPAEPSKSGLLWGGVMHLEGALATAEDPNKKVKPDASLGGGGFLHFGYGEKDSAAWISGLVGARYFAYQGMSAPSKSGGATPHGMSYWLGVAFPRAAGLTGGFHYNRVAQNNGTPDFSYTTWSLRLISAKSWFYFAMGVEGLLTSDRKYNIYDEFGIGPNLRISLEMGVNIGAPLSK